MQNYGCLLHEPSILIQICYSAIVLSSHKPELQRLGLLGGLMSVRFTRRPVTFLCKYLSSQTGPLIPFCMSLSFKCIFRAQLILLFSHACWALCHQIGPFATEALCKFTCCNRLDTELDKLLTFQTVTTAVLKNYIQMHVHFLTHFIKLHANT